MTSDRKRPLKPLIWVASARKDFDDFPVEVHREVGHALYVAQRGRKNDDTKVLKGFGDAGVLEVISALHGETFRTVYTVRFENAVYVLHAFQKKSKAGIATPKQEIELIRKRLKAAQEDYTEMMMRDKS